jgi:phage terminase large subunit
MTDPKQEISKFLRKKDVSPRDSENIFKRGRGRPKKGEERTLENIRRLLIKEEEGIRIVPDHMVRKAEESGVTLEEFLKTAMPATGEAPRPRGRPRKGEEAPNSYIPPNTDVKSLRDIVKPSDKQEEFLQAMRKHRYILYGGAKGGGKSYILRWALVVLLLEWAKRGINNVRVALFCEDYPSLKDRQINKISREFPSWLGKLADSQTEGMSFRLNPEFGGGVIALRNLDDPSKYASSEFAAVGIDELTKNSKDVFDQLRSIVRWPGIDDTRILAATNPGGVGHEWVKRLWIDRDFPPDEPSPEEFVFVQAFARDNPHISREYIRQLEGLPEQMRKAFLEGSWDLYEGQFFGEWREHVHVIDPFTIPSSWKRVRALDHGRTNPTACLWGAIDHDGNLYWYREYYAAGVDADVNAEKVAELSKGETYQISVMDSACFAKTGAGETIAEIYQRRGVFFEPWPKNRHAGWVLFHSYLRHEPTIPPKMVFFRNCKNAIRTIPSLVHDEHDAEDLDTGGEDHAADAVRGLLESLHEGKSAKPPTELEKKLDKWKNKNRITPANLNRFYAGRLK